MLTAEQLTIIKKASTETFSDTARFWLFGFRVHDLKRSRDIDFFIETDEPDVMRIVKSSWLLRSITLHNN